MNNVDESNLIGLFLLLSRLQATGRSLGRQTIVPLAEIKLPRVAQTYDTLIDSLQKEHLIEGDAEGFVLCPDGLGFMKEIIQKYSLHTWFYNEYYQAILHSQAHHLFCERVYGKDLGQHGMADMEQIHALIFALELEPDMQLLDFGCGDGQIAKYIAETTQTRVTGVDISDQAIQLAEIRTRSKSERIQFYVADREGKLEMLSKNSFDRILAIDSVFFVPNQQFIIRRFLDLLKPGGRLGVFYICVPDIGADETPFARALMHLGKPYQVQDFSAQNTAHWRKKKQTLIELESLFKAEGNEFLFKNRLAECDGLESFHRYLYMVAPS